MGAPSLMGDIERLKEVYAEVRDIITSRIEEFRSVWRSADGGRILEEMTFCLLTPQSKARAGWNAVMCMKNRGLFGDADADISECLRGVRFAYTKARRVKILWSRFGPDSVMEYLRGIGLPDDWFAARDALVRDINGYGYKEASHFLRNIGFTSLSILDRHILRRLVEYGVLDDIPKSLTRKRYLEIERKMMDFSKKIGIPVDHLDLLFWYMATGEVFK